MVYYRLFWKKNGDHIELIYHKESNASIYYRKLHVKGSKEGQLTGTKSSVWAPQKQSSK